MATHRKEERRRVKREKRREDDNGRAHVKRGEKEGGKEKE